MHVCTCMRVCLCACGYVQVFGCMRVRAWFMFVHACTCVCACGCTHIRCSVCMWRMHAQVGTTRYLCRHACTGVCVCTSHPCMHACMRVCSCDLQ